jgi:16S rRNA (adenine1518-N6/adenine1519-N6)-dimethyltransferase
MNLLALSVQYYSEPKIIGYISKNNFRPIPKVDSAIIRLRPRSFEVEPQRFPEVQPRELFQLIRIGFSEKRKQLASVLSKKLKLPKEKIQDAFQKEGISPTARAENLSLEQWQKLAERL